MSDYDAVLSTLDARLASIEAFRNADFDHAVYLDPVIAAAVAYARATVANREAYLRVGGSLAERADSDDAQEAAWLALRDAVVATSGPSE